MRKRLLSTAATLLTAWPALAQLPSYLPGTTDQPPGTARVIGGSPALLPATPDSAPPTANAGLTGGSTGLRPGVDCLPAPCDVCRPTAPRFYGDVAYMLTWIKDGPRNFPLAATTPAGLGFGVNPGTTLVGGDDIEYRAFSGIRGTAGLWLDCRATFSVDATGFLTERRSDGFFLTNDGMVSNPLDLARPVIDATTGHLVLIGVSEPGVRAGSVLVDSTSRLWGAEGDFVLNYRDCAPLRIDLLAGIRYIDLRETLGVTETSTAVADPGVGIVVTDRFDTRNQFYGGQVGSRTVLTRGRLELTLTSKLALGFTHEVVERAGSTSFAIPGFPAALPGGLLVQASNAGRDTRDRFAVVPETTIQLDYWLTEHLSAFIGYNFLYLTSVVRPGDQVDPAVELVVTPIGGLTVPGTSPEQFVPPAAFMAIPSMPIL